MSPELDNATIAARLDEYAALLELAGAEYYQWRSYRRAAELVRGTPAPIAELVRTGRVQDLRGIGPGIERRLRELVETGELAELRELERTFSPALAALGGLLGLGAKRTAEIGRALGISTVEEFRTAAAAGRLREAPGVGPKTEARIRAALEQTTVAPSRRLLLPRAKAIVEQLAAELGGVAAGDPRRWCDSSGRLAVVVP